MKVSSALIVVAAQVASAHYFFDSVVVNGSPTRPFQYIREFTRAINYNPIKFSSNPAADIRDGSFADGPDIVCNQGAFSNAGKTDILEVGTYMQESSFQPSSLLWHDREKLWPHCRTIADHLDAQPRATT